MPEKFNYPNLLQAVHQVLQRMARYSGRQRCCKVRGDFMLTRKGFSRRQLLRTASSALLYYPLLRTFEMSEALAQTSGNTRIIFVSFPAGTYRRRFWPSGGAGPLGTLPEVTSPLEIHKADMTLFQGLNLVGATNHNGAMPQVLAGWGACSRQSPVQCGKNPSFPTNDNTTTRDMEAVPYSLDQRLADAIGAQSIKPFINMGIHTSHSNNPFKEPVSWKRNGTPNFPNDNPKATFDELFGNFQAPDAGSNNQDDAKVNVALGKKRILDYLVKDMNRIKGQLGSHESSAFEAHVTALDEINRDLNTVIQNDSREQEPAAATCDFQGIADGFPADLSNQWFLKNQNAAAIYKLQRRIMVQAMACNITRVGVWQMGCSQQESHIAAEGVQDDPGVVHHLLAHTDNDAFASNQQGQMREIAKMVSDLKSVRVGNGSLFDETLVYVATDIGDSAAAHGGNNIACFLLGTLGGRVKSAGQMVVGNRPYNHALVTAAQLMGLNIDFIGNTAARGAIKDVIG